MKKITIILSGILAVILIGCSGSETYRGSWKATDSNGEKFEIFFDAKSFTIKDSTAKSAKYDYTQNSVKIENSVKNYGIKLSDGRGYVINFPFSNDSSGIIKNENGDAIYIISRRVYLKYDNIYNKL